MHVSSALNKDLLKEHQWKVLSPTLRTNAKNQLEAEANVITTISY